MRDIETILIDLDKWGDIMHNLVCCKEKETTPEGKDYYESEIEFAEVKLSELCEEIEEAERFETANERMMKEAGHNERDFL